VNRYLAFKAILFLCCANIALADKYVLPDSDHRPPSVSPPCFDGEILSTKQDSILVGKSASKTSTGKIEVYTDSKSHMFTLFGGYIEHSQLKPGQKLRIWYRGKSCQEPNQPLTAARVMIASERPGDDW